MSLISNNPCNASAILKVLDPVLGEEELVKSWAVERAQLKACEPKTCENLAEREGF